MRTNYINVTKCYDCPFYSEYYKLFKCICLIENDSIEDDDKIGPNCPLRRFEINICLDEALLE